MFVDRSVAFKQLKVFHIGLSSRCSSTSFSRRFASFASWKAQQGFIRPSTSQTPLSSKLSSRLYSTSSPDEASSQSTQYNTPRKFKPFPFPYHQELTIDIVDITNLGLGVGKVTLEDGRKWVIMVPTVLVGEEVKVRIYRNYDSYSEADLVEIIKSSPNRVTPLCPYFQQCGGCQYQHMNITNQRQWKQSQVQSLLQRIAGLPLEITSTVNPVVGTNELYHYRSKISPHYDLPPVSKYPNASSIPLKIGFQQRNSKVIVDIDQCIIASQEINVKFNEVRQQLHQQFANPTFQRPKYGATLLFRHADDDYICTNHKEVIQQTVKGITFQFKAGEFFQNNPYVLPLMIEHVLHYAIDDSCKYLVDAYCGSGLFALHAASSFQHVYGVEVSDLAIKAAKENAQRNHITNVDFLCASSEAIFKQIQHLPSKETVIIIDPPRKGCDDSFLQQLFTFQPKKVVYVSCDPATQARDTKAIVANGYEIVDITPFDLFPQTRHIENVIVFQWKGDSVV